MHEIVYFGRSIPWIIIDAIPYFRRFKLQDVSHSSLEILIRRLKFPLQQINGHVQNMSSFNTSLSNYHKSTYSIPSYIILVFSWTSHSLQSQQWPGKSQSSLLWKIRSIIGLTELYIGVLYIKTFIKSIINILLLLGWLRNMLILQKFLSLV